MNLLKYISKYFPVNEQEMEDKMSFFKFIENYDDVLTRNNIIGHFTASAFIFNKARTKVLMVYHNIYKSYAFPGGHADGDDDFLRVAIREAKEETGIKNVEIISNNIAAIDVLSIAGHMKNGEYVSSHLHYNLTYLLSADEEEELSIKKDENSDVMWIAIDEIIHKVTEEHMKPVYLKLINKIKEYC